MIKESFASAIEHQQWTGQIREATLQGLSEEDVKNWPVQFAEKIVTVKDFSELYHSFMAGALKVVLPFDKNGVVQAIIDLHENYKSATSEDWERVRAETLVVVKATDSALAADANRGLIKEADAVVMAVRAGRDVDVAHMLAVNAEAADVANSFPDSNSFPVANAGANAVAYAVWIAADDACDVARVAGAVAVARAGAEAAVEGFFTVGDWEYGYIVAFNVSKAGAAARQEIRDVFLNADGG
ncbi:hypothetical protein N9L54_07100 [Porticoccaceae bacterium]|nr:hypothetical protein [Porticoccaceae bacterium]